MSDVEDIFKAEQVSFWPDQSSAGENKRACLKFWVCKVIQEDLVKYESK